MGHFESLKGVHQIVRDSEPGVADNKALFKATPHRNSLDPMHTAERYIALCGAVSSLLCLRSTDLLFAIPAQQIKSLPLGEMYVHIVPLFI